MPTGETPLQETDAEDLAAVEERFAQALSEGDVHALDRIVAEDWILIGPDGRIITRAGFLDVVRSGVLTHSAMESSETRVRVYGDTALVTARVVTTGAYQGQAFTTRERASDVFVRETGLWKCVLTQLTTIPDR